MTSLVFSAARRGIAAAVLVTFAGALAASAQTPIPVLSIVRSNQNVTISWFGTDGVAYQFETSSDLQTWSSVGSVIIGSGNVIAFQQPIAAQVRRFYRARIPAGVTAVFNPMNGVLTTTGDDLENTISVSRDATGNLRVNNGAVAISGGSPTVANTTLIRLFGHAGADQLTLDESNGPLPAAQLYGGDGNDTLTGGSGADLLEGGPGDDSLSGKGGTDLLHGGSDNDSLTGGDNDDQVYGEAGNDRLIWNPGDDTDLNEGGTETDTVEANGGNGAENFTVTANGPRVRFDRLDPSPFFLDIGTCEKLVLNANGGDDKFSATGNLAPLIQITVDGGAGDDNLLGSNGPDVFIGGDNNDFVDGNQGNDVILLGAGDDTAQWDPGDGSDTIEGQGGNDRLLFNGSNIAETFSVSGNAGRVRFTRDIASIVMDLNDVEILEVNALGGADTFNIADLTGTGLTSVIADLATFGGAGDGASDLVNINGTLGDDIITATFPGGDLFVTGLAASVLVDGFDAGSDTVRILGLEGDDIVDASAVSSGGPNLLIDSGSGNDILLGSASADTISGGDNDDTLLGNGGADLLDGGTGENTLVPDGANVTSGIVTVFGDASDNTITITRDGAGNLFSNGVIIAGATIANTSLIRVFGLSGDDTLTLNEANGPLPAAMLFGGAGTDTLIGGSGSDLIFGGVGNDTLLGKPGFDLLFGGAGDDTLTGGDADDQVFGESDTDRMIWNPGDDTDLDEGGAGSDTVEVNGGNGTETFTTTANATRVRFDRIDPAPFFLDIGSCERLTVNANGGNDTFSATGNLSALIQIVVDGGPGDDTLLGSNGADLLIGGDDNDTVDGNQGNDVILLGAGNDTAQWDPGDGSDTIEGQDGFDTVLFNGANVGEAFAFSANAGRVLFTRNVAAVTLDLNDVEVFQLRTLGAADTVTVNNLAGTDLSLVSVDLASTVGGTAGDAQSDGITLNGTASPDVIDVAASSGAVTVFGLVPQLRILHSEAANDSLTINGLGGTDTFNVGPGVSALLQLTTNQ